MTAVAIDGLEQLDLGLVQVHKSNPRRDVGDLTELAASIKEVGVVEPIVVVRRNGHFEAVAGSRRLAAARKAGLTQIPARVMELDEAKAAAIALIENLQRKDLDPLEEAQGYADYIALTGCKHKDLGQKVGRAESTISNALRLLEAPKVALDFLRKHVITAAHVRVILELKDPDAAGHVLNEAGRRGVRFEGDEKITVRDLKFAVDEANRDYETEGPPAIAKAKKALEDAKAAHPKATITWGIDEYGYAGDDTFVVKALGKAPAKILGRIYGGDSKKHDKVCGCLAFTLIRSLRYSRDDEERASYGTERACIDPKGWKKFNPSGVDRRAGRDRPKSKAQREKEMVKDAEDSVASVHRYHAYSAKEKTVHAKAVRHPDIERVILMALADHMSAPSYTYFAWQAVKALSPKQVRERIKLLAAQKVLRGAGSYGSKRTDRGMEAVLGDLKIAPADLGYETKAAKK